VATADRSQSHGNGFCWVITPTILSLTRKRDCHHRARLGCHDGSWC